MPEASWKSEFLFRFNGRSRADAAAELARQLGYMTSVQPGDGEGRHFVLRLRLNKSLSDDELDALREGELRPFMARHRGRHLGCSSWKAN